jgi:uncharacterized protein
MPEQPHIQPLTEAEILEFLNAHARQLYQMGARRLGLFGSFARGEATPESDIDLLVVLEKSTFDRYFGIKCFLEEHFGRKVDLVEEKMLKSRIVPYVMKDIIYVEGLDCLT